jgi:hypothetical protein
VVETAGMMAPTLLPKTAMQGPCQRFARNCATRSLTSPHDPTSTAPLTSVVVWAREVLRGVVNSPRIDGKDGVAGSIPAGGSTQVLTSGNAGQVNSWASSAGPLRKQCARLSP